MNNKFEELDEKAREYGLSINDLSYETFHGKLIELVVLECIQVMSVTAEEAQVNNTYIGDDVPTIVHQSKIKNHFGIK